MITYESLKELAQSLSKVTGHRYVAFYEDNVIGLFINLSNSEMMWHSPMSLQYGFWYGGSDYRVLSLKLSDLPELDWSKCQFDCEEK